MIKTKQYKHQEITHERTKSENNWMFLFEQGLGKTKSAIDTASWLFRTQKIEAVLVLAPNGVHEQWLSKEYPKHSGVEFEGHYWIAPSKMGKRKETRLKCWLTDCKDKVRPEALKVFTMNIEAVRNDKGFKAASYFLKNQNCLMILDEATVVKNPKATQSKRVYKLAEMAEYKRALTGTPINNSPLDVWGITKFLDQRFLPYPTYTAFKHRFAEEVQMTFGSRSFKKISGYRNLDELAKLLGKYSTRYEKEDCLDLPEKIFQERWVPLSPEQEKVYKEMKSELMSIVGDKLVATTTVLSALMKCQQVVSGFIIPSEGELPIDLPNRRTEALMHLLDEIGEKVVIWCCFKHNVVQISRAIAEKYGGDSLVTYYSETNVKDRAIAVERINSDPRCRFFVATNAASKGLTLTGASHAVYFSRNYKLEDRLQSLDRIHRIGQVRTCIYHDLVTPNTVDEGILKRLSEKEDLAASVIDKIKEMI